jgi:hypothetical protein
VALEKTFRSVPPQAFTADGTSNGIVKIADTTSFKIGQHVRVQAVGQSDLIVKITDITDINTIMVDANISLYTLIDSASISAAAQRRSIVGSIDVLRAVYSEAPTVAFRTTLVDQLGNSYNDSNPLPMAFDGTINIGDVTITDGTNDLKVNSDGSINVVTESIAGAVTNIFSQISSLVANSQTQILSYTVPISQTFLLAEVEVSGTNIAVYEVYIGGVLQARRRTYFGGSLSDEFNFTAGSGPLMIASGGIISVKVTHMRPDVGDFEARLLGVLQ